MSDWNLNNTSTVTNDDEASPFGRFHQSGCTSLADQGLELLSVPTLSSRRLGVDLLKEARATGDRLATCVLGMCAIEGVGYEPDEEAGVGLLEEAASMGSRMAEDYLANHALSSWVARTPELASTDGLAPKARLSAERENAKLVHEHRERARDAWRYVRSPLLRGSLSRRDPRVRALCQEIVWRGEVTDALELDVCMALGTLGDAHATYLAALAYERGAAGVLSYDVAARLMKCAMRAGHHDALMWVRFARRSGRVA